MNIPVYKLLDWGGVLFEQRDEPESPCFCWLGFAAYDDDDDDDDDVDDDDDDDDDVFPFLGKTHTHTCAFQKLYGDLCGIW